MDGIFKPFSFSTRISYAKTGFGVAGYCPNLVTMQFGFNQFLPKSFFAKEESAFLDTNETDEKWYQECLIFYTKKVLHFNPFEFLPSFHYTKKFEDWWFAYYHGVTYPFNYGSPPNKCFFVSAEPDEKKQRYAHQINSSFRTLF